MSVQVHSPASSAAAAAVHPLCGFFCVARGSPSNTWACSESVSVLAAELRVFLQRSLCSRVCVPAGVPWSLQRDSPALHFLLLVQLCTHQGGTHRFHVLPNVLYFHILYKPVCLHTPFCLCACVWSVFWCCCEFQRCFLQWFQRCTSEIHQHQRKRMLSGGRRGRTAVMSVSGSRKRAACSVRRV